MDGIPKPVTKVHLIRRATAWLAVALWLISMFLPVVTINNGGVPNVLDGAHILKNGWVGPLMLQFGWYANILMLPAACATGRIATVRKRRYIILAAVLIAFWTNTLFWSSVTGFTGEAPIVSRHAGYYLWMAATGIIGSLLMWLAVGAEKHRSIHHEYGEV